MDPYVLLSRVGVVLALLATILGAARWGASSLTNRYLTLFLGGTAIMGGTQIGIRICGPEPGSAWWAWTAWIGNLWTGFCALAFLGALSEALPAPARRWFRAGQWGLILGWASWCWANPAVFSASFAPHLALNAAGLIFGAAVVSSAVLRRDLGPFWLGLAALFCQSLDLLGYLALRGSLGLQLHEIRIVWAFRNGAWCAAYAFFIYLLTCPSPSRSPSFS